MSNNRFKLKQDYIAFFDKYLDPIKKYYSGNGSVINFPDYYATSYDDHIINLESFSRPLWGFSFVRIDVDLENNIFQKIIQGTNPSSEFYWGEVKDYSQIIVEMFPILFFCFRKKATFDKLDLEQKANIERWFNQINYVKVSNNNWQCFIMLVNLFLKKLNLQYSDPALNKAQQRIENMYLGNGWYSDGLNNQRDYYIAFAFHYYLLLYAMYTDQTRWRDIYYQRAIEFGKSFMYWFADNGSALPFGRSLTYKFAQSAFWSMLIACKADPQNELKYKAILNANIEWWDSQKIVDHEGKLYLGYSYSNHTMTEYYNATGSSYWALKTMAILLLDEDDTVFQNDEEIPDRTKEKVFIPEAKMMVYRTCGHVYAFVNGQRCQNYFGHEDCKYEKFVYSTNFGFSVSKSSTALETLACDSNLAISFDGHSYIQRRNSFENILDENMSSSIWAPAEDISIKTYIIMGAPVHIRVHLINTKHKLFLFDGGFAADKTDSCTCIKDGYASVENCTQCSKVVSVLGAGEPCILPVVPNTNVLFNRTLLPGIKYELNSGQYVVCDAFYGNISNILKNNTIECFLPKITVTSDTIEIGPHKISITYEDGTYKSPNQLIDAAKKIKKIIKKIRASI